MRPEGASAGFDLNTLFKSERRIVATYSGALEGAARRSSICLVAGALDPSPLVTHTMPLDDFEQGRRAGGRAEGAEGAVHAVARIGT